MGTIVPVKRFIGQLSHIICLMKIEVFAARLKELRRDAGISALALSKATGLTNKTIFNYENQRRWPTAESVYKLADYFKVSMDYLCGRRDD